MNTAKDVLESFDQLSEIEKQRVACEILRRTLTLDSPQLADDELVLNAAELFLELDRREVENAESYPSRRPPR